MRSFDLKTKLTCLRGYSLPFNQTTEKTTKKKKKEVKANRDSLMRRETAAKINSIAVFFTFKKKKIQKTTNV